MALFDTTFAPYVPFGSRTLSRGKSGTDVAVLQSVYDLMLKTMNPPRGPMGSPIAITGKFDDDTVQAVKNIQQYFGLTADGTVGPNTYFVFGQGVDYHTTYGGPVYGSRQLNQGSRGGDVTILQNRLNCFRYARILGHPASGSYNAATISAVLAFKRDAEANGDTGFPDNGIAGYGFYNASWIYTFAGGRAIESGRDGFDVVFLQKLLSNLGYYSGPITGYYSAATQAAVRAFQKAENITADGVVGPVTFYHLGLHNPNPAPSPLDIAWPTTAPAPQVSVCSIGLSSTTSDLHPYGEATHVINQSEGFESLDVVGNNLPSLSGTPYEFYAFTATDPASGKVVITERMVPLPGNDWAGAHSPGVKTIPDGVVTVYKAQSRSTDPDDITLGPSVLKGNLANCCR